MKEANRNKYNKGIKKQKAKNCHKIIRIKRFAKISSHYKSTRKHNTKSLCNSSILIKETTGEYQIYNTRKASYEVENSDLQEIKTISEILKNTSNDYTEELNEKLISTICLAESNQLKCNMHFID